ncbi:MAG TPA: hypothetical protein DCZ95_01650 [Verrucomicrobia bacterium]|nr:MAG: hypothetical protein A2X46_08615 [Lentisphaerae bacterium GWF2_57_35]HBA82774.1 hypothetical protein [Verrucomicrobiota bacterium]
MKAFRANLIANLIFFRRNRLAALVALFICFIWATTLIPSLFFVSARDKFQLIKMLIEQSQWFVMFFTASLAVMTLYYNFNQRCFKMVITKPCPSEIWLLAHFAAVLLVAAVLYMFVLAGALILFKVWHIPLQWGVFYVIAEGFLQLVVILSVLSFLVTVMHPFLAIILISIFNEGTFYGLLVLLSAALHQATAPWVKFWYGAANVATYAFYLILPSYSLFEKKVPTLHSTLRMGWGDLKWLGLSFLYTVLAGALFYTLSALALRRRRHT